MADNEQTVYCEECVEDIPGDEVYWDENRLYCKRCGSEVEPPDADLFERIRDNRDEFLFRNELLEESIDREDDEEEDGDSTDAEEEDEGEALEGGGER